MVEVLLVSVVVTTVSFSLPLLWGKCTVLPTDMSNFTTQQKELVAQLIPFKCDPRTEYNKVASPISCNANVAIRQVHVFDKGLYDIHIHLKHIPFLEPEVPASA